MLIKDIRDIAIDSAKTYYQYLDENNKGIHVIDVLSVSYIKSTLTFKLASKIFDTDSVYFYNDKTNTKYANTQIKITEYDIEKHILIIKPHDEISHDFYDLKPEDIKVVSDLKFLVERVRLWYESHGDEIALPKSSSKLSFNIEEADSFKNQNFQLSENQRDSLKNIFENPFSYIWGAPGTGKTQFVLAFAILCYLKQNGKVAILAPTNNSIEQVLRGIIKMTDAAGVEREKILRLGTASRKFSDEFPQVCEEKGVQKKLAEVEKEIKILKQVLQSRQDAEKVKRCGKEFEIFNGVAELINNLNNEERTLDEAAKHKKSKREQKASDPQTYKKENTTELKVSDIKKRIAKLKSDLEIRFNLIQKKFSDDYNLSCMLEDLNRNNWEEKQDALFEEMLNRNGSDNDDAYILEKYKHIDDSELNGRLSDYRLLKKQLIGLSTEERLKSVSIVACTLDCYIGRFAESKLNVDHIFLDEAGYANLIKALTLFHHTVPVSFLGDHMQLPPVCEISDMDIKRDSNFHNMFLWAQSSIYLDSLFSQTRDVCLNQYLNNLPLQPKSIKTTSLNSTYRFGANLAKTLGKHVYGNRFSSHDAEGVTQIFYLHAEKTDALKSRTSLNEVKAVQRIVQDFSKHEDYIILAPYKNQIKLLNKNLPQERNDFKILTVHGSQGREWDTVILSVVDTYDRWFTDSKLSISKGLNLLNTAISRARKRLIIVCDCDYWHDQTGQLISDLIQTGTKYND